MITTNTGAKIMEGSDNWRSIFPDGQDAGAHNASVLAHDACIEGLQDALGIVVDGDQAAVGASTGQYIILKNSTITGCTDGLYTATKAIPANTSIDNTYLSAVSGGGLNALNTQIKNVYSKICYIDNTQTGTKRAMSGSGTYTATINLFVAVNAHIVASSNGTAKIGISGTGVNIIDVDGTNGACNFWVSCLIPMKAGQTLIWNISTNATDSNFVTHNILFG